MELLVVILILAILASLIVPRVLNKTGDAKKAKAESDLAALRSGLSNFRLDCDRYPASEEGLDALRREPADIRGWRGPYLERAIPTDPWGTPYVYEDLGDDRFSLISLGPDTQPGNDDIGNDEDIEAAQ